MFEIMCAKKTPSTPTKQNTLASISKAPVKKVTAIKLQTTKAKADASPNSSAKDVKVNTDAKKSTSATSSKKATKALVSETKAPSAPTTPVKGNIKSSSKDAKKINSRDSSTDNAKGKKQPVNGKASKAKATDSDRDKSGENESSLIRDNKTTDAGDDVKSKCDSANEQCNKFEKSSSSLSVKSNGESYNVVKDKEQLSKKGGEKAKVNLSSVASPKKINNRSSDDGSKKGADKPKSSKTVKKVGKEKESKIKISNELKNLEIEMSKSNSSLAVVIQEGLMSSGVKTSICEMVKTKSRFCSNLGSGGTKKNNAEIKIHSNKESQEKVIKEDEAKAKTDSEAADVKKANNEPLKLIENDDKTPAHEVKTVVSGKSKISALVNAKNKIKSFGEQKKQELIILPKDADSSKPAKRKYVKKKRSEDETDRSKNNSSVSENDARSSDKIDQNKSSCVSMSDGKNGEVKGTSKSDEKREETIAVGRKDKVESSTESTSSKSKVVSKAKNQESSKVKKALQSLSSGGKAVESRVEPPSTTEKVKRKYVKKPKQVELGVDKKENLLKNVDGAVEDVSKAANASEKSSEAQKVVNVSRKVSVESPKTTSDSNKIPSEALQIPPSVKKLPIDSQKIPSDLKKHSSGSSQKNGAIEKKLKTASSLSDIKKQQEKPSKPHIPKRDSSRVETQGKVAQCKSKAKLPEKPQVKVTTKKQKVEVKQENDPLALNSSESENSSNDSDSDSDLSQGTFRKPGKSMAQHNMRNKKHQQIGHKRTRVASLNAIAKVHFLYENESRTLEANIAKAIKNSLADGSTSGSEDDEDDEAENESKNIDLASKR